jgi:hypothetical protein
MRLTSQEGSIDSVVSTSWKLVTHKFLILEGREYICVASGMRDKKYPVDALGDLVRT